MATPAPISRKIMVEVCSTKEDSNDALRVGLTFVNHSEDCMILHTVLVTGTKTDETELRKLYASFLSGPNRELRMDVQAGGKEVYQVIASASQAIRPDLVVMGQGGEAQGRLGSVVKALLNRSTKNLLIVKRGVRTPPGGSKLFLFALDGSPTSLRGLASFVRLMNVSDQVNCVIVSNYNGDKDKSALAAAEAKFKERGITKITTTHYVRDMKKTVGEQISEIAMSTDVDFVVCTSSQKSLHSMGSTSASLVINCQKHILVLKVQSEEDEYVQRQMSGELFW
eukprot:PhF_6_TR34690/c0_g1_i1/m.50482